MKKLIKNINRSNTQIDNLVDVVSNREITQPDGTVDHLVQELVKRFVVRASGSNETQCSVFSVELLESEEAYMLELEKAKKTISKLGKTNASLKKVIQVVVLQAVHPVEVIQVVVPRVEAPPHQVVVRPAVHQVVVRQEAVHQVEPQEVEHREVLLAEVHRVVANRKILQVVEVPHRQAAVVVIQVVIRVVIPAVVESHR